MTPYVAFFDLDGTLAVQNQPPFPVDVSAIRAFRSRGHYTFLCTGRSTGYLYRDILDIGFDGIIAGAGAYVSVGERVLYHDSIPQPWLAPIQAAFEDHSSTLIMETEACMVQLACEKANKLVPTYPRIYTAAEWQDTYAKEVVTKLTVYGPIPEAIVSYIEEHLDIIHHGHYEEVVPKGCSKANGIRRVLEALGLPREQSIGFGDSMNDYDMIDYVGVGVAMGNADDRVKAIADRVTAPFDEGGIAQVLNEFISQ